MSSTCQLKRPVSRMKEMVPCDISLLESVGKSLHPYGKICNINSFEELGDLRFVLSRGVPKWGCGGVTPPQFLPKPPVN